MSALTPRHRLLPWLSLALFSSASLGMACSSESEPPETPASGAGDAGTGAGGTAGAGGTGGGVETDDVAPELLDQRPQAGDDNVWVRDAIVLTFSEALDPESVTSDAVQLSTPSDPVPAELELSEDGLVIEVRLTEAPAGPAEISVEISDEIADQAGNTFAGASFTFVLPLWQTPGGASPVATNASTPALALDAERQPIVAWQETGVVRVARLVDGQWQAAGEPLAFQAGQASGEPSVVAEPNGTIVVAWQELGDASDVYVARFDGDSWTLLGPGALDEPGRDSQSPRLALDSEGNPIVAWLEDQSAVLVHRFRDEQWEAFTDAWAPGTPLSEFSLAAFDDAPALAASVSENAATDVLVVRWSPEEARWQPMGAALDRSLEKAADGPALAYGSNGALNVAWREESEGSHHLYAASFDEGSSSWQLYGHAIDVELDADVGIASLTVAEVPVVAWTEAREGRFTTYVARYEAGRWQVLGGALSPPDDEASGRVALALSAENEPAVAWVSSASGLMLRRYNESRVLPLGLPAREPAPCGLPPDSDDGFPQTLSATGCYADVPGRVLEPGAIPYAINAPLWSDGALKRRFIVVPDGETIGYTESGAWDMPVGTLLIKEFLLEREPADPNSAFIMETRFLIKRCEPGNCRAAWQGYSYQWNDEGTEAQLLDNDTETVFKDWPVAGGSHTHSYPSRDGCTQCHALAAGGTLGLQTGQLNRNFDYGETVDHQLRMLQGIGLFGEDPGALPGGAAPRLPSPTDPAFSTEERARAYFHANCSHCHRPDGAWPVINFLFDAPLVSADDPTANICNVLVPGDAGASLLYIKDSSRLPALPPGFTGDPMPPLASLLPDTRQLQITSSWIDGMSSCP